MITNSHVIVRTNKKTSTGYLGIIAILKKKQKSYEGSLLYCEIKKPLLYSCPTSRIYKIMGLLACFLRRRSSRLSRNAIFRHVGGGGGGGRGKSRWRRRLARGRANSTEKNAMRFLSK